MDRETFYVFRSLSLYRELPCFLAELMPNVSDFGPTYGMDDATAYLCQRVLLLDRPRCVLVAIGDFNDILSAEWIKKQIEKLKGDGL